MLTNGLPVVTGTSGSYRNLPGMSKRLEITVSDELWDALNVARGHEPRASFVKRALERALPGETPVRLREPDVVHPNGFVERKRDWSAPGLSGAESSKPVDVLAERQARVNRMRKK